MIDKLIMWDEKFSGDTEKVVNNHINSHVKCLEILIPNSVIYSADHFIK